MIRAFASFTRSVAICLFSVFLVASSLFASELILKEDDLFEYAAYLYKKGEYYRAVSEYKRLHYFFPDSSLKEATALQIGRSYMAGGWIDEAIDYWQNQIDRTGLQESTLQQLKILLGLSLLDKDRDEPYPLREEFVTAAFTFFEDLEISSRESRLILDFSNDWKQRQSIEETSPLIAGALSAVLPGAGSFYNGRFMEGTYAFFITGLFVFASLDAYQNNQPELGTLFGFFGVAFYGGNIYAAVNGVHKTNDKKATDQLNRLRQKHGIWFIPETFERKGQF